MTKDELNELLSLFRGRCGHQWVGATHGCYACPVCGDYDGDQHLASMEPIAVQFDDWGTAWNDLARLSSDFLERYLEGSRSTAVVVKLHPEKSE